MSAITVLIKDQTTAGKTIHTRKIDLPAPLVTVAEIIEQRVTGEVNDYNKKRNENYYGLVQPHDAEVALNGFRLPKFRQIDANKQIEIAKQSFLSNGFFILIDNIQAESLEQTFVLHQQSEISFVKLTPLVGG